MLKPIWSIYLLGHGSYKDNTIINLTIENFKKLLIFLQNKQSN